MALDPVQTVMLGVVDGSASVDELAVDVHEVVGLELDAARSRVQRAIEVFASGGLLVTDTPDSDHPERVIDPFVNPLSSCMEASSCTGRVRDVNLEVGDTRLRVACQSPRVAKRLQRLLKTWTVPDRQPLGFMLKVERRSRRHILVDRGGFELASASTADQAIAILCEHLSALKPLTSSGSVRLRTRAIESAGRLTVCAWPLLFVPPISDEALASRGHALVNRLNLDIDVDTGSVLLEPMPWSSGVRMRPAPGHLAHQSHRRSLRVGRVLLAPTDARQAPSRAQTAALLAGESQAGARVDVLRAVTRLVEDAEIRHVSIGDPQALLAMLR